MINTPTVRREQPGIQLALAVLVATSAFILCTPATYHGLADGSDLVVSVPSNVVDLGTGIHWWTGAPRVSASWGWFPPRYGHSWLGGTRSLQLTLSTNFTLTGRQATCARFSEIFFAVDDRIASAVFNGHSLVVPDDHSYRTLAQLGEPASGAHFVRGLNVLTIQVSNAGGAGGLYIEGSVTLDCTPPPEPPPWEARTLDLGTGVASWEGMLGLETQRTFNWYHPSEGHVWLGGSADHDDSSIVSTSFTLQASHVDCASFSLLFTADDRVLWAVLNGQALPVPVEQDYGSLSVLNAPAGSDHFRAGLNTLMFNVINRNGGT